MKAYFYEKIASTQDLAKAYLKKGGLENACFAANAQTAGYGKRGRLFYSPAGQGIYLSVALPHFHLIKSRLGLLTPAVATAIVQQLICFYPGYHFALKWVNDIYLEGKKVAGILTERVNDGLVIGVGINFAEEKFPAQLCKKSGSLHDPHFKAKNLSSLLVKVIIEATQSYQTGAFLPAYRKLSLVINKRVTLKLGTKKISGLVMDIDHWGRLILEHNGKTDHFNSGEVVQVQLPS